MDVGVFQILVAVCAILVGYLMVQRWRHFTLLRRYGIPGPRPSLISGNMLQVLWKEKLHSEIETDWMGKYGKVMGYYFGYRPQIIVNDLDMLKKIFIKDFANFTNRMDLGIRDRPVVSHMLTLLRDDRWKYVRSVVGPTFSAKKMKQMSELVTESSNTLVELLAKKCSTGEEFDIYSMFQAMTIEVIAQCALAMDVDIQRNPTHRMLTGVRAIFKAVNESTIVMLFTMFPMLAYLLIPFQRQSTLIKFENSIIANLNEVIKLRRQDVANKTKRMDVLQLLLNAAEGKDDEATLKTKSKDKPLNDMEIMGQAYIFILAGYETTSNALAFTSHLLATHRDVQDKLYKEIVTNIGTEGSLNYDALQKLTYLDQVFHESIRMYPPIPTFVSRETKEDYEIDGYTFPAGVEIQAPVWTIHHDPEVWSDPWKFDPDRFSSENKSNHHPMAYLSFGAGPRNCIGARFALLESKLALVSILRKYEIVPADKHFKDPLPLKQTIVGISPKDGAWIKVIPRKQITLG